MSELLTTKEICDRLGICRLSLLGWIKEGCPVAGKRKNDGGSGGRPQYLFDVARVSAWCVAYGKNPRGIEGAMLRAAFAESANMATE